MNVHLLSHLPFFVKLYGPLWTHSAFTFEDSIGYLTSRLKGTRDIGIQVHSLKIVLNWFQTVYFLVAHMSYMVVKC